MSFFGALLLPVFLTGVTAPPQGTQTRWATLPQDVPGPVRTLAPVGPKAPSDLIHIAVALPYRNQAQIQAFVDSVSDPTNPNYRHFITPDEVGRRFGIDASQVKQVADYLGSAGMRIRLVAKNHLSILADATAAQAEAAFHTPIRQFLVVNGPSDGDPIRYSYTTPPSVPASIAKFVTYVEGLENVNRPQHAFSLTPGQLRTLYSAAATYNADFQGQGRTVGITDLTTYGLSNIPLLYSYFNLPTPAGGVGKNITVVSIDGSNGNVTNGADGEGDADMQCALMMAPLCNLRVYDGSSGGLYLATLTAEAEDDACDIITESAGVDGSGLNSWHNEHLSMSAEGITYLCASGDSGTTWLTDYPYPDADPEVLSVGGTTVSIDSAGNRVSEVVWDDPKSNGRGVGSGGWATITNSWNALPSWQVGKGVPTDIPYRLVPDVTLDADPGTGYQGFLDGEFRNVGGTSCGSPTVAGMLADCEQQIIANGGLSTDAKGNQRLGRLQDLIYSYNGDPTVFFDVVSGSNGALPNGQTSVAGPGWDTASGWGAPIFSGFVNRVLGIPVPKMLSLSPAAVYGGVPSTGTVTINIPAAPGGASIALTSNGSSASVPASVKVAAGATSATFTVSTSPVSASTSVTVSAAAGTNPVIVTGTLTINPPVVTSVSLSPSSVTGGNTAIGTVNLSGSASNGGATVGLSSSSSSATPPVSVTVSAGANSATFNVSTTPVTLSTSSTITATLGASTSSATLTITPCTVSALSLSPPTVVGGTSLTGMVTLSGPAPTGGASVALTSSSSSATVPQTLTVSAGATTAAFMVSTSSVSSLLTVTITASLNGTTAQATLTLQAPLLMGVSCSPSSVVGGNPASGVVTLARPAPTGGVSVGLSSSTAATVPTTVTVAAGASSATFTVATTGVTTATTAVVTAHLGTTTLTTNLQITPAALSLISVAPNPVVGGTTADCTVSLNGQAPSAGVTVTLASSSTAVKVPGSVTISSGASSTQVQISTQSVAVSTSVTITATLGGSTRMTTLTVVAPALASVSLSPTKVVGGSKTVVVGTMAFTGPAPPKGASVSFTSSNPKVVTVPASLTIKIGDSATFPITHKLVSAATSVTITASYAGVKQSATLTVVPFAVVSMSITPGQVAGGTKASGIVVLNAEPGSSGPIVVKLKSSSKSVTVPATASVGVGVDNGLFSVTSLAVAVQTTATITGSYGASSQSAFLTITAPTLVSLKVSPTSVKGSATTAVTGTVTISGVAPTGGLVVALSSSDTAAATVPAKLTIPAGKASATFKVSHVKVSASTSLTITGTLAGATASASLTVTP